MRFFYSHLGRGLLLLTLTSLLVASGCPELPIKPAPPAPRVPITKLHEAPSIRLGLFSDPENVTVRSPLPLTLVSNGAEISLHGQIPQVEGMHSVRFRLARKSPGTLNYRVVVRTFEPGNRAGALALVQEFREKGHSAEVLSAGTLFEARNGQRIDTRVIYVAVGEFPTEEQAVRFRERLAEQGYYGWLRSELVEAGHGEVDVLTPRGQLLARAALPIRLIAQKPRGTREPDYSFEIQDVPFGFWTKDHETRRFHGDMEIDLNAEGQLQVINRLNLEDYLKVVVPSEMLSKSSFEALCALAVAARSEAFAKIAGVRHPTDPFDICASQHCQVYRGVTWEADSTSKAVEKTNGEILIHEARVLDAVYSSNCGGHSENNDAVWSSPPHPAMRGVPDYDPKWDRFPNAIDDAVLQRWLTTRPRSFCAAEAKNYRWRVRRTAKELNQIVDEGLAGQKLPPVGRIQGIELLDRGVSGRLKAVKITGSKGSVTVRKELPIRRVFGALFSAMFMVDTARDQAGWPTAFTFIGGGRGHGVGMCQAGADGRALAGYKHQDILGHYFRGANIARLY